MVHLINSLQNNKGECVRIDIIIVTSVSDEQDMSQSLAGNSKYNLYNLISNDEVISIDNSIWISISHIQNTIGTENMSAITHLIISFLGKFALVVNNQTSHPTEIIQKIMKSFLHNKLLGRRELQGGLIMKQSARKILCPCSSKITASTSYYLGFAKVIVEYSSINIIHSLSIEKLVKIN